MVPLPQISPRNDELFHVFVVYRYYIPTQAPDPFSPEWSCALCTLVNTKARTQCEACGAARPRSTRQTGKERNGDNGGGGGGGRSREGGDKGGGGGSLTGPAIPVNARQDEVRASSSSPGRRPTGSASATTATRPAAVAAAPPPPQPVRQPPPVAEARGRQGGEDEEGKTEDDGHLNDAKAAPSSLS